MIKRIIFCFLAVSALISGVCFTHFAIDAGVKYDYAQLEIDFAGDNSKAMQKANDTKQHIDEIKSKWVAYWIAAAVSYFIFLVFSALLVITLVRKKSKNVRE